MTHIQSKMHVLVVIRLCCPGCELHQATHDHVFIT